MRRPLLAIVCLPKNRLRVDCLFVFAICLRGLIIAMIARWVPLRRSDCWQVVPS
jgi:hypothetical protein